METNVPPMLIFDGEHFRIGVFFHGGPALICHYTNGKKTACRDTGNTPIALFLFEGLF